MSLLAATLLVAWGTDPISTLLPSLVMFRGGRDAEVGLIASAFGLGAVLATATFRRLSRGRQPQLVAAVGFVGMGVGLVFGALAPSPVIAAAPFAVGGIGFVYATTAITSTLQAYAGDRLVRRVMGLWGAAFIGGRLPAALVNGALADGIGVVGATLSVGTILILAAASVSRAKWGMPPLQTPPQ